MTEAEQPFRMAWVCQVAHVGEWEKLPCPHYASDGYSQCEVVGPHDQHKIGEHTIRHAMAGNGYACAAITPPLRPRDVPYEWEMSAAKAWVDKYYGERAPFDPDDPSQSWYWEMEAKDAYEMVVAVLMFSERFQQEYWVEKYLHPRKLNAQSDTSAEDTENSTSEP